jgi:hypothetical protein
MDLQWVSNIPIEIHVQILMRWQSRRALAQRVSSSRRVAIQARRRWILVRQELRSSWAGWTDSVLESERASK